MPDSGSSKVPLALSVADIAVTAAIHGWHTRFAACVRAVDYAAAVKAR